MPGPLPLSRTLVVVPAAGQPVSMASAQIAVNILSFIGFILLVVHVGSMPVARPALIAFSLYNEISRPNRTAAQALVFALQQKTGWCRLQPAGRGAASKGRCRSVMQLLLLHSLL